MISNTSESAGKASAASARKRRMLITLSYDGTAYAGWQRQENAMTIQQKVEEALRRLTGEHVGVNGASRTDAGVHALGQCAHFDTASCIVPRRYPLALNACLPRDIRVVACREVADGFHARFNAKGKRYTYRIHNASHASALHRHLCAHVPQPLDVCRMQACLPALLGTNDFAAFQAAGGTSKTTMRTIREATLSQKGEAITFTICGNSFLYNMVRIIAGTLVDVGLHKLNGNPFEDAFHTGNRLLLGSTAPARGLELTEVIYTELEQKRILAEDGE